MFLQAASLQFTHPAAAGEDLHVYPQPFRVETKVWSESWESIFEALGVRPPTADVPAMPVPSGGSGGASAAPRSGGGDGPELAAAAVAEAAVLLPIKAAMPRPVVVVPAVAAGDEAAAVAVGDEAEAAAAARL